MVAELRIETEGTRAIEQRMAQLIVRFEDLTPLTEAMGVYLESATIDRFDTETAPDGNRWEQSIRAREEGGKTLTDSAQLRSSITSEADASSTAVGTNKIYAGVHQDGATITAKSSPRLTFQLPGGLGFRSVESVEVPARPFLGLSRDDEIELHALAEDFARDAGGDGFQ